MSGAMNGTASEEPVRQLKYSKLTDSAFGPTRGSERSAGYDLYSAYDYTIEMKTYMRTSPSLMDTYFDVNFSFFGNFLANLSKQLNTEMIANINNKHEIEMKTYMRTSPSLMDTYFDVNFSFFGNFLVT
ncbi:unnamed protein product [Oppiella nova]|uniref:Uncharacterized protein n=1 Tax=Oppiella nova TaxID=334625 RepID=A0A7R9M2E1_9ACAR|nr:unnamed protein product [Oppiella nova]CAG2169362.1 unnamed protein product [Oppiella nova]